MNEYNPALWLLYISMLYLVKRSSYVRQIEIEVEW